MPSNPVFGAHDPQLLERVLGTAEDPADAAARAQAAALAHQAHQVVLPPAGLSGWSSLCAGEYAEAVARLQRTVGAACSALAIAAGGR